MTAKGGGGDCGGAAGKTKNGKRRMTLRSGRAVLGDLSNKAGSQGGAVRRVYVVSGFAISSLFLPPLFPPLVSCTFSSPFIPSHAPGRRE